MTSYHVGRAGPGHSDGGTVWEPCVCVWEECSRRELEEMRIYIRGRASWSAAQDVRARIFQRRGRVGVRDCQRHVSCRARAERVMSTGRADTIECGRFRLHLPFLSRSTSTHTATMSHPSHWKRLVALVIALLSATINLAVAIPLFSLWRFSKTIELESEWEGLASAWVKSLNALGGLALVYFSIAAAANIVGFVGMIRVRDQLANSRHGLTLWLPISATRDVSASGVTFPSPILLARLLRPSLSYTP